MRYCSILHGHVCVMSWCYMYMYKHTCFGMYKHTWGNKKRDLCNQKDTMPLFYSSCKRVRVMKTPLPSNALLKRKTGVYRGTIMFLISALKHRLWVPVRTASVPTLYVLSKNKKLRKISPFLKLIITTFKAVKYRNLFHGHVCVITQATKSEQTDPDRIKT